MRILVHMGNYKTGSTALQHFFYINREILRQHGLYYGCCDDYPLCSHASFTYRILIEALEMLGMTEAYRNHPLAAHLQQPAAEMWEEMVQAAEKNGCERILLSHEAVFCEAYRTFRGLSYVPEKEELKTVWNMFHKKFSTIIGKEKNEISCIIYLRETESYLNSQYNQYIKEPWYEENPELPSYEEFVKKQPVTLEYNEPLSVVKKIYGDDSVWVCRYEDVDNLYASFLQNVPELPSDIWHKLQMPAESDVNKSLSFDAVAFKKNVLGTAFARSERIQKILEEYSMLYPDEKKYTWVQGQKDTYYPGITEEKIMKIMDYVTARASEIEENS